MVRMEVYWNMNKTLKAAVSCTMLTSGENNQYWLIFGITHKNDNETTRTTRMTTKQKELTRITLLTKKHKTRVSKVRF